MKTLLKYLCGYRKHTFNICGGWKVSFWTKTRSEAVQKALNFERQIRMEQEKVLVNRMRIMQMLISESFKTRQG